MATQKYFATETSEKLAAALIEQFTDYSQAMTKYGMTQKWAKSYRVYYGRHYGRGNNFNQADMLRMGEKGELVGLTLNHYRNLIKHIMSLTCDQKLSFDCMAINSDAESLAAAKDGNKILESYLGEKKIHERNKVAAEHALVFGKGFTLPLWDLFGGKPYSKKFVMDPETNQPAVDEETGEIKTQLVYEGDLEVVNPSAFDTYCDPTCEQWHTRQWDIVRLYKNRYDLMKAYPSHEAKLMDIASKDELTHFKYFSNVLDFDTPDIPVYYFFHKKTLSLPNGRVVIFCDEETVLYDGPLPYADLPLKRIVPGEVFGTTEGYTDAFDLIGIQEALNVLVSIAFTNQQAMGVQKIWVPDGANLSQTMLSKGLAVLRGAQGAEPKPLQLTATAKEIFEMIPMLQKQLETLSGINSVARGSSDDLGKNASGVAIAYVQAMAVQYNSNFQNAWARLNEDVATHCLDVLQKFVSTERKVALIGAKSQSALKSFTGQDLKPIDRVRVTLGNPMMSTFSGKLQVADNLMGKGLIKTAPEYLQVLETGNLEVSTQAVTSELDLIAKENDALRQGRPVQAIVGDGHLKHAQEHKVITNDPDLRARAAAGDPQANQIIQAALAHIQQHNQLWHGQMDPFWSAISGEPPAPPPPPPPGMMMPPPPNGPVSQGSGGAPPKKSLSAPPHNPIENRNAPISALAAAQGPQKIPRLPPGLQPGEKPPIPQPN